VEYLKLLGGLILLLTGGDLLVRGGVSLARHFHVSTLVIGITVVAFGTSAPEFIVSLDAAISGHPEISIGNVVGSNIANIALVLGLTASLMAMPVKRETIRFAWPVMFISSILFYWFIRDARVERVEGIIFFAGLLWFIWKSFQRSRKQKEAHELLPPRYSKWVSFLLIAFSVVALAWGSRILIQGASTIARSLGVTERIISITIVAFGTSLPELAASVMAAVKKEADISIGNIIGSNIFNLLGVIGLTAAIHPIPVNFKAFRGDTLWMIGFALALILFVLPLRKNLVALRNSGWHRFSLLRNLEGGQLWRIEGLVLFVFYVVYVVSII
jgi:cation:H+ antiporter